MHSLVRLLLLLVVVFPVATGRDSSTTSSLEDTATRRFPTKRTDIGGGFAVTPPLSPDKGGIPLSDASLITSQDDEPIGRTSPSTTITGHESPLVATLAATPQTTVVPDTLPAVTADLARIASCPTRLVTATHSRRDSSYTRNWSHDDWEIHHCAPLRRYVRHVTSWITSPTAWAVLPVVSVVAVWSLVVVVVTHGMMPQTSQQFLKASSFSAVVGTFTAPVSLLLTLRTNRALDRLLEARRSWGILIKSTTSLAGLIAVYVMPHDPTAALLLARYLALLGWAFKGVFMLEDDQPLLETALPPVEVEWLTTAKTKQLGAPTTDTATAIMFRTRATLAALQSQIPTAALNAMEERLAEMETALGICKRILGSPIPPTFSRHSSRILCLYLTLLPLGLVGSGITPAAIVLQTALVAYVFIGIDEISMEIEDPFRLLPLFSLSSNLQRNVLQQFQLYHVLPKENA